MIDQYNDPADDLSISANPNAVISWSGTANTLEAWCAQLLGNRRHEIWNISPMHNIRPGLPPMIVFHGYEDPMVPYWFIPVFARQMQKVGNDFTLHDYPGRKHYLGQGIEKYAHYFDEEILEKTDQFLKEKGFL
jgi:acetyl esterase/lipase